jgi:transposase
VVDDYVGPDNQVRFIEAFVAGLDLQVAGFVRVEPKGTGRPGYDPADLLKLYLYGYLNRVRSSRQLEVETRRNIEVIWLLRHLKPDLKTIANFRRVNHAAFRQVFREFVLLCRQLDLFGHELLAVDGTRIKAVNWESAQDFGADRRGKPLIHLKRGWSVIVPLYSLRFSMGYLSIAVYGYLRQHADVPFRRFARYNVPSVVMQWENKRRAWAWLRR